MRYFLTVQINNNTYNDILLAKDKLTGNLLFSFESMNSTEKALEWVDKYPADSNWIVDSGAFAAWNSGKSIDREKLLAFYKLFKKHRPDARFINLDVIPGSRGHKPTKAQAREACEKSWENYLWFKSKGVEVMPVFHEDDDWEFLYKMMKETDYIAISPANDSSVKRRMIWLDKVFSILKGDYKTHGLAATSPRLMERYPFYSVDSINWVSPWMFGRSSRADAKSKTMQGVVSTMTRTKQGRVLQLHKEVDYYISQQRYFTKLWERRGIKW